MRDDSTWIQTYTGRQVWPLDPKPEDFDILDIAHALSNICRYAGHVKKFYSVAQHCVLVARYVELKHPKLAMTGLLHDASEAYIADIARPIKHALKDYLKVELRLEQVLAKRFGLTFPYPPIIKEGDNTVLNTERRDLLSKPPRPHNMFGCGMLNTIITAWTSEASEKAFLELYRKLGGYHV